MAPATRLDSGQRYVQVRQQRAKRDYAEFMQQLLSTHYHSLTHLHVLQDNLNTHQAGSFYDRFDAVTAHELANRFVFHYTPTHGSWLNMAEIDRVTGAIRCSLQTMPRPHRRPGDVLGICTGCTWHGVSLASCIPALLDSV